MTHRSIVRPLVAIVAAWLVGCASPAPPPDEPARASPTPAPDATARALAFLEAHPELVFGGEGQAFRARAAATDDDGAAHVRFDRVHRGLRVLGGDVVAHARADGAFDRASHTLRAPLPARVTPTIAAREAIVAAALPGAHLAEAELVVLAQRGLSRVAWDVTRRGRAPDGTPSARHALVDAETGLVLARWDAVRTVRAKGHGLYADPVSLGVRAVSGGYLLADDGRGGTATLDAQGGEGEADAWIVSDAKVFGDGTTADPASAAVDAQRGLALTWDYFAKVHGRRGHAGDGLGLVARVHFGQGYANAFYAPDCACVTFGDGDDVAWGPHVGPLVAIDVVAHEATHALTAATAGLLPTGEPGAIDEATSDVFATMIERWARDPGDPPDWTIGERVLVPAGRALRDLAAPEVGCWDPDVGALDPHVGSGVASHFVYLLAEGTTPRTTRCDGGGPLHGIGHEAAARIWFRALTVYMTSDTGFAEARAATLEAAADLYGEASPQRRRVAEAWAAVGVP